jgi:hypothetical protein
MAVIGGLFKALIAIYRLRALGLDGDRWLLTANGREKVQIIRLNPFITLNAV